MASQSIDELKIELEYEAGQANSSVKELKDTLTQLSASTTGITSKLNNISKSLGNFKTAMTGLDTSAYAQNVAQIAQALVPLQNLGKSNLGSFVNQLKKIPDLNKSLDANTIQEFTTKINQLSVALSPLAKELNTVSVAFSRLPNYLSKTNSKLNKYNVVANKTSAINSKLNFAGIVYGIRKFNDMISDFITASNSYVENLNLFTVAMGANTDKALEWIGTIEQALGVDPSGMMRYMGVFQMITSGFGLSSDAAYKMSKNLTQLTYDISSFYNIGVEEAALKVQSAISGELEPVRRLGYALDQATLQQVAYNNGIEESYTQMTQAEKAQLRYIALLTQNQQVQGDMGRTILSAANSIRVLKQQFAILGREIGNIFIPMMMKIIPVAIAVTKVLIKVAKTIANLLGFTLPDLNWDTVTDATGGMASDMDDAVGSAKEFKKQLQGFDELNLLTSPSAGGSGVDTSAGGFELELPEYDMLEGFNKGIEDMTKQIMDFFGIVEDASGNLSLSWKEMDGKAKVLIGTLGILLGTKLLGGISALFGGATKSGSAFSRILAFMGGSKVFQSLKGLGTSLLGIVTGGENAKFAAAALKKQLTLLIPTLKKAGLISGSIATVFAGAKLTTNAWGDDLNNLEKDFIGLTKSQREAGLGVAAFAASGALLGTTVLPGIGSLVGAIGGSIGGLIANLIQLNQKTNELANNNVFGTLELTANDLANIDNELTGVLSKNVETYNSFKENLANGAEGLSQTVSELETVVFKYQMLGSQMSGISTEDLKEAFIDLSETAISTVENTADSVISQYQQMWAKGTELTEDEQKEIIQTIKGAANTRISQMETIQTDITAIVEKASNERRDLTADELKDIEELQQKLIKLTQTNLTKATGNIEGIVKAATSNSEKLSSESWNRLNTQLKESTNKAYELIEQDYANRLELGETYAQDAYDQAIARGASLEEADQAYANAYAKIYQEAETTREKAITETDEKIESAKKKFYEQMAKDYYAYNAEYMKSGNVIAEESAKKIKQLLEDAGFTSSQIIELAGYTGINAGTKISDTFDEYAKLEAPKMPDITDAARAAGSDAANNYKSAWQYALQNLPIPKMPIVKYRSVLDTSTSDSNTINLRFTPYASGGFPDAGEFFLARESGPEMVGRIGNKTTVANNDQIVEGISAGVYEAVVSANVSNPNMVQVNLGNKTLYNGFTNGLRGENNRYGVAVVEV